jgi:hypothetical protein
VSGDVVHDVDGVLEIEMGSQRSQVIGVVVHVVTSLVCVERLCPRWCSITL